MIGIFITYEGPDRSGKSTQAKLTADYLQQRGLDVVLTREPGGTSLGEKIRHSLLKDLRENLSPITQIFLFGADRRHHVETVLLPALEKGQIVLCDRYTDSTAAYQGHGKGVSPDIIEAFRRHATNGLTSDLTLLYDITWEQSLESAKPDQRDRFEREGPDFFNRVREGYQELAKQEHHRIKVVERVDAETKEESIVRTFEDRTLPPIIDLLKRKGFL